MPDKTLEAARALIRQKRYSEARRILEQSDNPEAADWLLMMQQSETSASQAAAATVGLMVTLSVIVTGIIFAGVSYFVFLGFLKRRGAR